MLNNHFVTLLTDSVPNLNTKSLKIQANQDMLLIYAITERVIGLINKKARNCLEYIYFNICM